MVAAAVGVTSEPSVVVSSFSPVIGSVVPEVLPGNVVLPVAAVVNVACSVVVSLAPATPSRRVATTATNFNI